MTQEGQYIYCIINQTDSQSFGPIGIDNREVTPLCFKDIAAVVSPTPITNFDRFGREDLTKYIAKHQKVNEVLMQKSDVVPMSFGIIAQDQAGILSILEKAYLQFKTALKKITGKAEFAVQILWDEKKSLERLISDNQEINKFKKAVESKGLIMGLGAKLKLGKMIAEAVEKRRRVYLQEIQDWLKDCCLDFSQGKLFDKTMIGNISCLIKKTDESMFDNKMQELGERYGDELRFKYVGPMPAYSFVNINLSLGNFEVVDEARKSLGLVEEATLDEIKQIYYTLAHQYHPDKHQGKEEQMKKITKAYRLLENYCQSYDDFIGKGQNPKYSFKEEYVKNLLIIK